MLGLGLGLLGIGGSIAGGIFGSKAEKNRLRMQDRQFRTGLASAQRAEQFGREVDRRTYNDLGDYRTAGSNALGGLQDWMQEDPGADAANYVDPGYQFRLNAGSDAIANNAGASGLLRSGDTLRALTEYGQDMGSQEYGNAFNRGMARWQTRGNALQNMAGMGQSAAMGGGQVGLGAGNIIGDAARTTAGAAGHAMSTMDAGGPMRPWADMASGFGGMGIGIGARSFMPTGGGGGLTSGGSNFFSNFKGPGFGAAAPYQSPNWLGVHGK